MVLPMPEIAELLQMMGPEQRITPYSNIMYPGILGASCQAMKGRSATPDTPQPWKPNIDMRHDLTRKWNDRRLLGRGKGWLRATGKGGCTPTESESSSADLIEPERSLNILLASALG